MEVAVEGDTREHMEAAPACPSLPATLPAHYVTAPTCTMTMPFS